MTEWQVLGIVWYCIGMAFFIGMAIRDWNNITGEDDDYD